MNRRTSTSQLLAQYAGALSSMRELHAGTALAQAAALLAPQLPSGRLLLLATSIEGTAVAAVCAAERAPLATRWERLNLALPVPAERGEVPVLIEPVDGGTGWRHAIEDRYPGIRVLFPADDARHVLAA